jgi:hypothetical protein
VSWLLIAVGTSLPSKDSARRSPSEGRNATRIGTNPNRTGLECPENGATRPLGVVSHTGGVIGLASLRTVFT